MTMFSWVDGDMRYFIVKRGPLEEGQAVLRQRWIQVVVYLNEDAHMVELDINKPLVADI